MLFEKFIINNFLTNRLSYINIDQSNSFPIFLNTGVPQGSSISPLLYIMFSSDLPELPTNTQLYQ